MPTKKLTSKKAKASKKNEVNVSAHEPGKGELKHLAGSQWDEFNNTVVNQTVNTLWLPEGGQTESAKETIQSTISALRGIAPKDELEGMLAAQLCATHAASMECHRRAMLPNQTFEGRKLALQYADRTSRTYAKLLDTLNKHRGKGQQKVTVEHVHVHEGGQAIVGSVSGQGGGSTTKTEEQPHAKQIADASDNPLRCKDQIGKAVPSTCSNR